MSKFHRKLTSQLTEASLIEHAVQGETDQDRRGILGVGMSTRMAWLGLAWQMAKVRECVSYVN